MKTLPFTVLAAITVATSSAIGTQLSVSIEGFAEPISFLDPNLEVRFTELVPSSGTNSSTHILIEGLEPLSAGAPEYASTYSGIDVTTGAIQDTGVLYMKMPPGDELPVNAVVSPIVGVVQRPGDWSSTAPIWPPTVISGLNALDTPSGTGYYDDSTMTIDLSNGTGFFSGTVDYSVPDPDTIVLQPFVLVHDGVTSYSMSGATLIRDNDRFFGVLINEEASASYDSLIFSIDLDSIPDIDFDSIPDISDPIVIPDGNWIETSIGWVWSFSDTVAYSYTMGWVNLDYFPTIYAYGPGAWFQYMGEPASSGQAIWMHSPTIGWVYTQTDWYGDFYKLSGGWVLDNFRSLSQ